MVQNSINKMASYTTGKAKIIKARADSVGKRNQFANSLNPLASKDRNKQGALRL
jgi:hypothetical protein